MSDDLVSPVTAGVTAIATPIGIELAKLMGRVLRPPADQVGNFLGEMSEYYLKNLAAVLKRADERAKEAGVEKNPMHPRVAFNFIKDASFAEDELATEYFSGLAVASKKSEEDQNIIFLSLLRDMTSTMIRFHYALYGYFYHGFVDEDETGLSIRGGSVLEGEDILRFTASNSEEALYAITRLESLNLLEWNNSTATGIDSYVLLLGSRYFKPTLLGDRLFWMAHGLTIRPTKRSELPSLLPDFQSLIEKTLADHRKGINPSDILGAPAVSPSPQP